MRSLVQAVAAREDERWRRTEEALERLGEVGIGPYAEQRHDFTPAQERDLRALVVKGWSLKRIARKTGIGIYRVRKAVARIRKEEGR